MVTTIADPRYRIAVPSVIVSTIAVLVVDVLVIWLVHHSLLRFGSFLTLRQVLNKKRPVLISEIWFEDFTGRTHGPLWFRYTQALLKITVFFASIALSLSLKGSSQGRVSELRNQTILVQNPRSMRTMGLGQGRNNYTQEVAFTKMFGVCQDRDLTTTSYYNMRSKSPLRKIYSTTPPEFECLMKHRRYVNRALLTRTDSPRARSKCKFRFTAKATVVKENIAPNSFVASGKYAVVVSGCKVDTVTLECFHGPFAIACAAFYIEQGKYGLANAVKISNGAQRTGWGFIPPLRRGKDTLAIIARYLAHDGTMRWRHAFRTSLYQAVPNSSVYAVEGQTLVTEVKPWLFWPSMVIIIVVLAGCSSLGLASMAVMKYTKCDVLDVGLSPEQVVRLASMNSEEPQERKLWYLQLHPNRPYITVCTDSVQNGKWAEEEVRNKYRKREKNSFPVGFRSSDIPGYVI